MIFPRDPEVNPFFWPASLVPLLTPEQLADWSRDDLLHEIKHLNAELQLARNLLGNASGALADYTDLPTDTKPADAIRILQRRLDMWEEEEEESELLSKLNLAAEFAAEGRTYVDMDDKGRIIHHASDGTETLLEENES